MGSGNSKVEYEMVKPIKLTKVPLKTLIANKDNLSFDSPEGDRMIPYGSNYLFDRHTLVIDEIVNVYMLSETPLYNHLAIRNPSDSCYLWFTEEQYASIKQKDSN